MDRGRYPALQGQVLWLTYILFLLRSVYFVQNQIGSCFEPPSYLQYVYRYGCEYRGCGGPRTALEICFCPLILRQSLLLFLPLCYVPQATLFSSFQMCNSLPSQPRISDICWLFAWVLGSKHLYHRAISIALTCS